MKFRTAKKIMQGRSSLWRKWEAARPRYFDEELQLWCSPSYHDIPQVHKAASVYLHHCRRDKKISHS